MEDKKKHNKKQGKKKDLDAIRRKNKAILEKVKKWQSFQYVKPLICSNENCNEAVLKPKETKYRIMLQCPKCKRVQTYVPSKVLQIRLEVPDVLVRNQEKHGIKKDRN